MLYAGIDYHKRSSFVCVLDDDGVIIGEISIDHRYPEHFASFFTSLGEPVSVVFESSANWSWLYEILERISAIESISLANPYKVRVIAEAQIKTDKLDARRLAMILRLGSVPCCHIPTRHERNCKEVYRQRAWWVKQRTAVRNRIHTLLSRQHDLQLPQVSDLFGKTGMSYLRTLELDEPDGAMLQHNLEMLAALQACITREERLLRSLLAGETSLALLRSIPGVGPITGAIIALETGGIERFPSLKRYTSYAGFAPGTRSSADKTHHGRMLRQSNRWLKWAYIEAAWVAVGRSGYFGSLYRHHRSRGKGANTAITIVARRLCHIVWHLLRENREYEPRSWPRPLSSRPDGAIAV